MDFPFYLRRIGLLVLLIWKCHEIPVAQTPQHIDDSLLSSYINELNTKKITDYEQTNTLFHIGLIYNKKGVYDSALVYLTKALGMPGGKEFHGGRIFVNIANTYVYQGRYVDALKYYLEALSVSEKEGSRNSQCNIIRAMANISETYYMIGNHSQALYYAEGAYEKYVSIKDESVGYILPQIFYIIGSVHLNRGDLEKAEEYMSKAYETADVIYQQTQNTGGILIYKSYGMEGLAKVYLTRKDTGKALDYANKALDFAKEDGNTMVQSKAYSTLSDIYLAKEQYETSKEIALKAIEISCMAIELNPNLAFNIAVAEMFAGGATQALRFFQTYSKQVEQNTDKHFRETMASMEIQYETEKKELRIASLEKEKQLYTWLGIAGLLFAVTLGIILRQNIRNMKKEKQLIATRSIMDGEMGERTRLARDLHDRLSGSLSAVKIELNNAESLLNVSDKLDSCIEEVRRVAHNLMPVSLQYGIKVALEDFAARFPDVHFHFFGEERRIEERIEFVIYCCANELVNNSLCHSGAGNINLQLVQDDKHITLTVQDDGIGYDEKFIAEGLGLKNIRNRVTSCNGKIDIASSPNKGTETTIELKTRNNRI